MWNKIANIILRNRFSILTGIALVTVFFGYHALTGLKIDNKYGNMLPKSTEAQRNYMKFKNMFGEDGGSLVIAIQCDSLYTEHTFRKWKELGDTLLQINGVTSVISEASLFRLRNVQAQNRFEIHRIFSDTQFKEKTIDSVKKEIRENPLYDHLLYNDSSNVSIMIIAIDERFLADQKKQKVILEIEELAQTYESEFGQVHFAGLPHMRVVIGKRVMSEMFIFVGLSIFVTSLLLYLFFRSLRVMVICNIVVLIAVIWSMGTIGLLNYNVSILMALIPPLMIVIGVPNCIYLMTKYHQEYVLHQNKIKALTRVIKKTGTATFLTNFTTALGFSTFMFTNSEKLEEFGTVASINIIFVFIISICIIPIIASLSKKPKERHLKHLDRKFAVGMIEKLVYITSFKRTWIYITCILIAGISIVGVFKIEATGNLTGDLPPDDPILNDIQFMQNNFGGAVPFEIMIDYKSNNFRGFLASSKFIPFLKKVESVQELLASDTMFSKSIALTDFLKVMKMSYYNNKSQYKLISNRDKIAMRKYFDNLELSNTNSSFSLKELVDTTNHVIRIRTQMKDIGSYEVADKVVIIQHQIDTLLNPDKAAIERLFAKVAKGKKQYIDSIVLNYNGVYNKLTSILAKGNADLQVSFDNDAEKQLIKRYYGKKAFQKQLRTAIDDGYYDVTLTGTSVVASEGTRYLVINLFSSLLFAVISISILMALLFRSFRMVIVSMVPNLIPLLMTAGIMGWFGIPLKPSTLLVFSIALGISVDDTIHFLAKYRQELKLKKWDLKQCVIISIRESGLSMFYTSIVLFCGFSVFMFSQFGGTQALGLLISLTLLVAMITNLVVLPSLLLSYERQLTTKSFEEPYFEIYDEDSDINWDLLTVEESKSEDPVQSDDEDTAPNS